MKYDVKCGLCLHKFDCRETTLSTAANHFKILLIEFEICLYNHLYFLYIRNPQFPIVVFISMLWQLKIVFTVCSTDKTNIFFTLSMKNVLFILDILFSVTMVTY